MFELINCQEVKDTLLAILGLSKKKLLQVHYFRRSRIRKH